MNKIKEILCLHHSHLDIGYTHPQPLLMELQRDYIDEAIDLCLKTEDFPEESKFRWTCEATYPVLKWLETSEERKEDFQRLLQNGQISISAMLMHTTPLTNSDQLTQTLYPIKQLREQFNIPLNTAMNHDVNGQPWPISQVLLDAGIDFYITGINIHFGGIPFERPAVFNWQTPDNRELLTFHGEHYSLFSQFFETSKADTTIMAKGINEYVQRLEEKGYDHDFIYLTATNPPLFDNNCPDPELVSLIRKYNTEEHGIKIRFVTPEMLLEKVKTIDPRKIKTHAGDWTDYWNFGSGSSARETRLNRKAKQNLKNTEFLEAFQGSPGKAYDQVKQESMFHALLFDEHTWGASQSIENPDDHEVYAQQNHKSNAAYKAADFSAYILGKQMEKLTDNPLQSNEPEGIVLVNTSSSRQQVPLDIPEEYLTAGRHLSAARIKQYLPYWWDDRKTVYYGMEELAPFSWKKIPFIELEKRKKQLDKQKAAYEITDHSIETAFYRFSFDSETGRIKELYDKTRNWSMLNDDSNWTFFELVRESINPLHHPENRSSLFPRDVDLGNKSISVWNHDWKNNRTGVDTIESWNIEQHPDTVTFVLVSKVKGIKRIEQKITFSSYDATIQLSASLDKEDIKTPESFYFAFPLHLESDWRSQFDTAGMFIELDKEQLGKVSKDWVTVDQTVSIYDQHKGVTLACPDAPLVQIGDFNFGKESETIDRNENPLLLAWPLNNYWDTNFWASQPGHVQFHYEIKPIDTFNPVETHDFGVKAAKPVEMNAVIACPKQEKGQLIDGKGDSIVPLYIKPAKDQSSIIITLRNLSLEDSTYSLSLPQRMITAVSVVNSLEEPVTDLEVVHNEVDIPLRGRELVHVKINSK